MYVQSLKVLAELSCVAALMATTSVTFFETVVRERDLALISNLLNWSAVLDALILLHVLTPNN